MISEDSKYKIIDRLLLTAERSYKLELRLLRKRDENNAKKVARKSKKLTKQLNKLIANLVDAWLGEAATLDKDIRNANANLQRSITKISKDVDKAQNIVKAIGLIDDVISIAKGLLKPLT